MSRRVLSYVNQLIEATNELALLEAYRIVVYLKDLPDRRLIPVRRFFTFEQEEIIQILSRFKVNPKNPLEVALAEGSLRRIETLLKKGAKLTGPQWRDRSPAELVFRRHNIVNRKKILQLLVEYGLDLKFRNEHGTNLLHSFADSVKKSDPDAVEIAKILLDAGVPLDEFNRSGMGLTPTHCAIFSRNSEFVSYLVSRGADVNEKTRVDRICPLMIASNYNELELAKLLVSKGADVNARDSMGSTPLHSACRSCSESVVRLLIRSGADVSAEDEDGITPLHKMSPARYPGKSPETVDIMIREIVKLNRFGKYRMNHYDLMMFDNNRKIRDYRARCLRELDLMATDKFHRPYTYQRVLNGSMSMKKLAVLAKNKEFVSKFNENLADYPIYRDDLTGILEKAVDMRDESVLVEFRLKIIFKDLFPDTIVRKLGKNLSIEELPL